MGADCGIGVDDDKNNIPVVSFDRLLAVGVHALVRAGKPITIFLDEHNLIDVKRKFRVPATVLLIA
jgi:hypothetical protein